MSELEHGSLSVGNEKPKKKTAKQLRQEGRNEVREKQAQKLQKAKKDAAKKLALEQENARKKVEAVEEEGIKAHKKALKKALMLGKTQRKNKEGKVTVTLVKPTNNVLAIRAANAERRKKAKNNFFGLTTVARNLYYGELAKKTHKANAEAGKKDVTFKDKGETKTESVTLAIKVGEEYANGFCVSFKYRGKLYHVVPNEKIALLVKRVNADGSEDVSKAQNIFKRLVRTTESFQKHAKTLEAWHHTRKNTQITGGAKTDDDGQQIKKLRELRRAKMEAKHVFREAGAKVRMASALRKAKLMKTANVFPLKTREKDGSEAAITKAQYDDANEEAQKAVRRSDLGTLLTKAKEAKESVRQATRALKDAKLQYYAAKDTRRAMDRAARKTTRAQRLNARNAKKNKKPVGNKVAKAQNDKQKQEASAPADEVVDEESERKKQAEKNEREAEAAQKEAQKLAEAAVKADEKAKEKTKEAAVANEKAQAAKKKAMEAKNRRNGINTANIVTSGRRRSTRQR